MIIEYKGYLIQPVDGTTMKEIVTVGKGSVTKELRGLYTNVVFAQKAIDLYGNREKVKKDGETAA